MIEELTRQEKVILGLLSRGFKNAQIQACLYISKNTLKTHMTNIYGKLQVSDRTQAAIWGVKNNFGQTTELTPFWEK